MHKLRAFSFMWYNRVSMLKLGDSLKSAYEVSSKGICNISRCVLLSVALVMAGAGVAEASEGKGKCYEIDMVMKDVLEEFEAMFNEDLGSGSSIRADVTPPIPKKPLSKKLNKCERLVSMYPCIPEIKFYTPDSMKGEYYEIPNKASQESWGSIKVIRPLRGGSLRKIKERGEDTGL